MKLFRSLFGDLGLVVLAVVFGWALWYTVREELNEVARREVTVVVEAETGLDVVPKAQRVTLTVQGPRRAVDAFLASNDQRLVRRIPLTELPTDTDEARRDFTKEDLAFADRLGTSALTVVDMDPPLVAVRVYRVAVEKMNVAPPEFQGASDLGLRYVMQSYTTTVMVRGAKSVLPTSRVIKTFVSRSQLQGFAESLRDSPKATVRLVLKIDPGQRDLFTLVEPTELSARVELSRIAEQELVLPVKIYADAPSGGGPGRHLVFAEINKAHFVAGDPPRVRLKLTGVPSALAALPAARVRAFVLASDLPDEQKNGDVPVHVADLPPGVALAADYAVCVEVGP